MPAGARHECRLQVRLADTNIGGHVDNVAAIGLVAEARTILLGVSAGEGRSGSGLLAEAPEDVWVMVAGIRVEYRHEMLYRPESTALVRQWIGRIGRSSFTVCAELSVNRDDQVDLVAESQVVLWDAVEARSWPIADAVRASLAAASGPGPITFRGTP